MLLTVRRSPLADKGRRPHVPLEEEGVSSDTDLSESAIAMEGLAHWQRRCISTIRTLCESLIAGVGSFISACRFFHDFLQ